MPFVEGTIMETTADGYAEAQRHKSWRIKSV